jgi:hypothetical protein
VITKTVYRVTRWTTYLGSSAILLQAGGCSPTLEWIQTGLLGGIAGGLYVLVRNV